MAWDDIKDNPPHQLKFLPIAAILHKLKDFHMCPTGRALSHPSPVLLTKWATFGCPTHMGQPWTREDIWEAVA